MTRVYLDNYYYISRSGMKHVPYIEDGKWYLGDCEISFLNLMALCRIPDEDAVTIRLTYGG